MKSKTYIYKGLQFPIGDGETATFRVELVSDGNKGGTKINVPGPNDKEIEDDGKVVIGTGKDLRGEQTITVSTFYNIADEEDTIRIRYFINDKLIKEHANLKSEADMSTIVLLIQFPEK